MHVLVVNPTGDAHPDSIATFLAEEGWTVTTATDYQQAAEQVRSRAFDVVVASEPPVGQNDVRQQEDLAVLVEAIETQHLAAVLLGDRPPSSADAKSLLERVNRNITLAELRGRLATIERYHEHLTRLERELGRMDELSGRLHNHFKDAEREMRLAARLQREYLPNIDEPVGNVCFRALYRPATWVSGDMFGVFRVDRNHTGFYVADVVGHGMAASLLTIYIKQALEPNPAGKRPAEHYEPSHALESLNAALAGLALPSCQFVTACYAVFDHRTHTLRYAGAGHPYPIRITRDHGLTDLPAAGGLLGVLPQERFLTHEVQLDPGDKLILYSDGLELAFQAGFGTRFERRRYLGVLESLSKLTIDELLERLDRLLNRDRGSLHPHDDITVLGLQILGTP